MYLVEFEDLQNIKHASEAINQFFVGYFICVTHLSEKSSHNAILCLYKTF